MKIIEELTKLKAPYFHLLVAEKTDFLRVYSYYKDYVNINIVTRFIEGSKCDTLDKLFEEFAKALQFPDYFGYNWSAFDECLNDLDWLLGDAYLLLLSDIDEVMRTSENDFKTFIKVMVGSVNEWTIGRKYNSFPTPPTPFHVVFHCSREKESEVKTRLELNGLKDIHIFD